MNVDLPDPLGPVKPYRRPGENVVVTSSKSTLLPYRMETPLTEIMNWLFYRIESSWSHRVMASRSSCSIASRRASVRAMASDPSL